MTLTNDLLYVLTGVPRAQLASLAGWTPNQRSDLEAAMAEWLTRRPLESLTGFLMGASAAFYLAERGVNPKIKTFVDAAYYISTCLSVGYADIFAQTQAGRLIATLVMTIGPALTGNALDPPGRVAPASARGQELLLQRLDAILETLRQQQPAPAPPQTIDRP